MNVSVLMGPAEAQKLLDADTTKHIAKIKAMLDMAFVSKISTPEQVLYIADLIHEYQWLSGETYKITFEENSII